MTGNFMPAKEKKQIAQGFNKAAKTYDHAANLQKKVGENLFKQLQNIQASKNQILDLGSGTGYFTQKIAQLHPTSEVIGLDLAIKMSSFSKQKHSEANLKWICGDADLLPFKSQSVDCVFSNLMLQWSPNLEHTFKSLKRILKKSGFVIFSTLGPKTLYELKNAWKKIDQKPPRVHDFLDKNQIHQAAKSASFQHIQLKGEIVVTKHESLMGLLYGLKQIGAHNRHPNRSKNLLGKKIFQQLEAAYLKHEQLFPTTYEVIYGVVK